MSTTLSTRDADFEQRFARMISASREERADVDGAVAAILADVKARGDEAVIEYTARWDRTTLTPATMGFTQDEITAAVEACDPSMLEALNTAAARITDYHRRQMPKDELYSDDAGIKLGWRWTPVSSAGLYVPGGTAALFSSVLMNAVPAKVAGVDEVYRIGGAQAIAALSYGIQAIKPVDKIVGPGNAYVASAKKQVFGTVGIDMVAGPSEVTVVADAANDPDWIAADLLAQAEHDASSQSILITDSADFAVRVDEAVKTQLKTLPRAEIATASWTKHGVIIVVEKILDAAPLIDKIAPEHLELAVADPQPLLQAVRHAGAIFVGRHTPEAVGDYIAGPSHVLPTSGTARFSSGLGVFDFLKRTSIIDCTPDGLRHVASAGVAMARAEELDAHARSIAIRLNTGRDG